MTRQLASVLLLSLSFNSLLAQPNKKNDSLLVGVLAQKCSAGDPGKNCLNQLQPAFVKENDKWSAFAPESKLIQSFAWTIAFDGKKQGLIPPSSLKATESGSFVVESKAKIRWVKAPDKAFSTFSGSLAYRPMVVVTQNNVSDPDQWKPFELNPKQKEVLWEALIKLYSADFKEMGCSDVNTQCPVSVSKAKFQAYRAKSGIIASKVFITTPLEGDMEGSQKDWMNWLSLSPGGKAEALLDSRLELWDAALIDAGDYDGDGRSELVFLLSGYNLGGYLLLNNQLKTLGTYTFTHH